MGVIFVALFSLAILAIGAGMSEGWAMIVFGLIFAAYCIYDVYGWRFNEWGKKEKKEKEEAEEKKKKKESAKKRVEQIRTCPKCGNTSGKIGKINEAIKFQESTRVETRRTEHFDNDGNARGYSEHEVIVPDTVSAKYFTVDVSCPRCSRRWTKDCHLKSTEDIEVCHLLLEFKCAPEIELKQGKNYFDEKGCKPGLVDLKQGKAEHQRSNVERILPIEVSSIDENMPFTEWTDLTVKDNNGLVWTREAAKVLFGYEVGEFIDQLNADKYGGYSDWRLPSIDEFDSLANSLTFKTNQIISDDRVELISSGLHENDKNKVYFVRFWKSGIWFWTSTTAIDGANRAYSFILNSLPKADDDRAWVVCLPTGYISTGRKDFASRATYNCHVMPVRGGLA